ncbi:HD domain-containing protein [Corynebacterium nasicanis]|uniref:HD domain-containing protein n=1 Tax=Corynebacterium nasicanis TaxID=1448267 RepID=A0ABW1QAZ7_9CORY
MQAPLTPRLISALNAAATAHRNHERKGSGIPYISHLYAVMYLAASVTTDEDVLIAALFHDVLEDVPESFPAERMRAEFGDRVTDLVLHLSKDDSLPGWQDRADAYLAHLEHEAPDEAVLIACADKLHNLMSILADHDTQGEDLWGRFNSGKERQQWWYGSVLEVVQRRLPDLPLAADLEREVARFRNI